LFDGFPRTIEQAKALDSFLSSKKIEITATIGLEADDEILIQRIIERGKTSQRTEDKDELKSENDLKSIMIKPHHSLIILNKVSSILLMESELLRMLHKEY
jgi:adenylate kinase family enzyme